MNVTYTREELNVLLVIYYMIRDCLKGEPAIKGWIGSQISTNVPGAFNGGFSGDILTPTAISRARRYLPMPNAADQSAENIERYKAYLTRAVFYNVTKRTLDGMMGQIFLIDPVIEIPTSLDILQTNADGQGLNIIQLAKRAVRYTLAYGRAGLLIDYPAVEGPATKKELQDGDIQPVVQVYAPWNVINWRVGKRGANTVLTLVVLHDQIEDDDNDTFQLNQFEQYRVLYLDNETGNYTVDLWESDDAGVLEVGGRKERQDVSKKQSFVPRNAAGQPFKDIPFTFIGAENNDPAVDDPPMYDLASLNLAHYRNSADHEASCFIVGQPTPFAIGLSEDWVKNVLKDTVRLGANSCVMLPPGADMKLLQANPNQLPSQAMKDKEEQMIGIGAKLVIQKRIQRTATESIIDAGSESSVLTNVANNVSAALTYGLTVARQFVGTETSKIKFDLNTKFELNRMTLDDIAKLVATWQKGAIAFEEMRDGLRKAGIAYLPNDEAQAKIKEEQATLLMTGPIADPFGDTGPAPNPGSDPGGHARNPAARGTGA